MKKFAKYLFLPFILFFIFSCDLLKDKNNYYYSKNGEIDLTSWNCEKDEIISLNGEWEFYPNSFLYSNDFLEKDFNNKKILINVPSVWNESKINNKNIRPFGFATYRIVLKLKENCLIYGIKIPDMSSSYKFFVNNKLVSSSGNPADNKKDERVKFSPDFTFIQLNDGDQIIIQVSNHVLLNGGIWKSIEIGSVKKMKENRLKSIFLDSLFIGGFLFIGLYYLLFFLIRKNDKFYLYFSLFCIIVSLRTLIISNSLIFLVFPSFSGIIALKLEYLTIFIGFPIYFLYNYYIYKKYLNNIVKKIFQFSGIVLTIIVALTDI
nr:7TM-DISM domain-containing protein [Spirochaetota bacterium]